LKVSRVKVGRLKVGRLKVSGVKVEGGKGGSLCLVKVDVVGRVFLLHAGSVGLRLQILDQPKQSPGGRFDEIVGGFEFGLRKVVLVECDVELRSDLPRREPRARPR